MQVQRLGKSRSLLSIDNVLKSLERWLNENCHVIIQKKLFPQLWIFYRRFIDKLNCTKNGKLQSDMLGTIFMLFASIIGSTSDTGNLIDVLQTLWKKIKPNFNEQFYGRRPLTVLEIFAYPQFGSGRYRYVDYGVHYLLQAVKLPNTKREWFS